MAIRVVLADDHAIFRLGLKALLATVSDITVVGEAASGDEAVRLAHELRPDVLVMDISMDGQDGMAATRTLSEQASPARVLVLTMHDEQEYLIPLLEAGAKGYIVKTAATKELVEAIRTVAAGHVYVRPAAAGVLARGYARRAGADDRRRAFEELSERERRVLQLVAQGFTATQIGEKLDISPKTVDTYKRRINDKTGLSERAEYVQFALELGLLGDRARP